jgi:hypothetical protein
MAVVSSIRVVQRWRLSDPLLTVLPVSELVDGDAAVAKDGGRCPGSAPELVELAAQCGWVANGGRERGVEGVFVDGPHLSEDRSACWGDDDVGASSVFGCWLSVEQAFAFDAVDEACESGAAEGDLVGERPHPQSVFGGPL